MSFATKFVESLRHFASPGWRGRVLYFFFRGLLAIVPIRRSVALESMKASFPGHERRWYRSLLSRCYSHYAWMLVEYLAAQNDPDLVLKIVKRARGFEQLDRLRAEGKGCIVLTGHIGNWEVGAAWLCRSGYPFETVVRDTDDADFAKLIEQYRSHLGVVTLRKEFSNMRQMIRRPQREGVFLALLADQDASTDGVPVSFLGRGCTMVPGPAVISLSAGVPLIPVYCRRNGPFDLEMVALPVVEVPFEANRDRQVVTLTCAANAVLEHIVKNDPEQWFWFHRRWKTHDSDAIGRWAAASSATKNER